MVLHIQVSYIPVHMCVYIYLQTSSRQRPPRSSPSSAALRAAARRELEACVSGRGDPDIRDFPPLTYLKCADHKLKLSELGLETDIPEPVPPG